ncbi:MAG: PA2779 family protein [Rhodocyclaceae bacterium]|nr:PA2779 family protein [Rhodocyclaceae bacterium]
MKSALMRIASRLLILSMLALPLQAAQAAMIGTDQAASDTSTRMERANLVAAIDRPEVARQLQDFGLDASSAKERVAAMTNAEVHALADNVNAAPAGANISGWGWAIIIALGVWAYYSWK